MIYKKLNIIIMKSKRKQVNKYHHRLYDDVHEEEIKQYIKRNTGNKPFQLTKLRFNKSKHHEVNLHHPYAKHATKREQNYKQSKDDHEFYLDLIIKKKNINHDKQDIPLNSERNILIYQDTQGLQRDKMTLTMYETQNKKIYKSYKQSLKDSLRESQKEQSESQSPQNAMRQLLMMKKNKKHCLCCKNQVECNAKIIHKYDNNMLNVQNVKGQDNIQEQNEQNEQNVQKQDNNKDNQNIEHHQSKFIANNVFPLHINTHHIYTNIKWRSKSQIYHVDKWKLKYRLEKQILEQPAILKAKSTTKISNNIHEGQSMQQRLFKKKYLLTTQHNENLRFPHINQQVEDKGRISDRSIKDLKIKTQKIDKILLQELNIDKQQVINKLMKTKLQSINEQSYNRQNTTKQKKISSLVQPQIIDSKEQIRQMVQMIKKRSRQANNDIKVPQNVNTIDTEVIKKTDLQKQNSQQGKKRSQQSKKKKKASPQNEIVIKKMYADEKQNDHQIEEDNPKQTNNQISEELKRQQSKLAKKKWKFPSIQITTVYSSKQQQDAKRKQRLSKIQKYSKEWRLKAPQKVINEKIVEDGLQRWNYVGSRQDSREQVEMQIRIQQQQQLKMKQQKALREEAKRQSQKQLKQKEQVYTNYLESGDTKFQKLQNQLIHKHSN